MIKKIKNVIWTQKCSQKPILSACFCWGSTHSLREMDQNFEFGRLIGNRIICLDSVFRCSELYGLLAILHYAAGAVRSHTGKGPGYCYMIGRGPSSCLLGHVTGLLFCLYVKLFLPSILNSANFWSSMSLILVNIKLTGKNMIKELGLFIDGSLQGFSLYPPKTFKPDKQTTWNTINTIYMELPGVVETWILRNFLRHKSDECRSVC